MKRRIWFCVMALIGTQVFADSPVSVDANGFVAFKRIDSDRNGYVSRVEARSVTGVEKAFDAADRNSDGLLDRNEYTSVHPARKAN